MGIITLIKLVGSLLGSKLGILILSGVAMGGFGLYHKVTVWRHDAQIAKIEKERDEALKNWINEKQRAEDLEKTIQFQRNQLARRQQVQKEVSDVDKAVGSSDLEYLRRNERRLHDYKNPAAPEAAAGRIRKRFKPPSEEGTVHR